jgi:hypothetical protein
MVEKSTTDENAKEVIVGVLLIERENGSQVGFISFNPSGVLGYQVTREDLHVYVLKPIDKLLINWEKDPLYIKHANLLDENSNLPFEILEQEANSCADFLNSQEKPLQVGKYTVVARMVHAYT